MTQGTADGDKNVVARILEWKYAEDIHKLARTHDTYFFGYARPDGHPPAIAVIRWLPLQA